MILLDETNSKVRYKLDAGKSTFTVQAFASGFLSGMGHNPVVGVRNFTGEVEFVPETFAEASLRLEIDARSLETLDGIKEKDKQEIQRTMHEQVLETTHYPEIVFQSTSITTTRIVPGRYKARIIGDLTMHGVTNKNLWLSAQLTLNENELRAKGDFTINQTSYDIKPVSVAAGALKLKDELKFEFDLVGLKEG